MRPVRGGAAAVAAGLVAIAVGTVGGWAMLVLAGLLGLIFGWTLLHPPLVNWVRPKIQAFLQRHWAPWILATVLGAVLVFLSNSYGPSWLILPGVPLFVIGVARIGLNIRRSVSNWASPPWGYFGLVLVPLSFLFLVGQGVPVVVAGGAVVILAILVVMVVVWGRSAVLSGVGVAFLAWLGLWLYLYAVDRAEPDPHPDAEAVLVAMGDSYMSGEGASQYLNGTNVRGLNECRRASTSYAYQVAAGRPMSLAFLACSGARTSNVTRTEQYPGLGRQIVPLREIAPDLAQGSVVLISIGGNDAGFGEIGRTCLVPGSCRVWGEQWLRNIRRTVQISIEEVFKAIRREVPPHVPVFAVTYPVVLADDACVLSPLAADEHEFLAAELTVELNDSVKNAARAAGLNVIDLESALLTDARRICDRFDPGRSAINIFGLGPVEGSFADRVNPTSWFHSSLHPNKAGHDIFATLVTEAIEEKFAENRAENPVNPEPDPSAAVHRLTPLPRVGEDPRAFVTLEAPLTPGDEVCSGVTEAQTSLAIFVDQVAEGITAVRQVFGAMPASPTCVRDASGVWAAGVASPDGVFEIPYTVPVTHETVEAFYVRNDGDTVFVELVFCEITPSRCLRPGTSEWVSRQLRLAIGSGLFAWALVVVGTNLAVGAFRPLQEQVDRGAASEPAFVKIGAIESKNLTLSDF